MTLVSPKEMLVDGRKNGYGIGSLQGAEQGTLLALLKAADDTNSPLLVSCNAGAFPMNTIEVNIPMIIAAARQVKAPIGIVLDHAGDMETIRKAIDLGANLVMFDGSQLPYEENLSRTREVVEYSHPRGVTVEAELGCVPGTCVNYDEIGPQGESTDPDLAEKFVAQTGVDALAISFGNSHGLYHTEPQIDLERVKAVYHKVEVPLVMHGASGLDLDFYPQIVKAGITKFNYYTTMAIGVAMHIRNRLESSGDNTPYYKLYTWGFEYNYQYGIELMKAFCSTGQGKRFAN